MPNNLGTVVKETTYLNITKNISCAVMGKYQTFTIHFQSSTSPSRRVIGHEATKENNLVRDARCEMLFHRLISYTWAGNRSILLLYGIKCSPWKPPYPADLGYLHPSTLHNGWQTDFSWYNMKFDLSMTQDWRCKNLFSLLFCINTPWTSNRQERRKRFSLHVSAFPFQSLLLSYHSCHPWLAFCHSFFNTRSKTFCSKRHLLTLGQHHTVWKRQHTISWLL